MALPNPFEVVQGWVNQAPSPPGFPAPPQYQAPQFPVALPTVNGTFPNGIYVPPQFPTPPGFPAPPAWPQPPWQNGGQVNPFAFLPPPPFFPPLPPLPFLPPPPNPFAMMQQFAPWGGPPNPFAAANDSTDIFGGNGLIFLLIVLVLSGALAIGTTTSTASTLFTTLFSNPVVMILLLLVLLPMMGGGSFFGGMGNGMTPLLLVLAIAFLGMLNLTGTTTTSTEA